MITRFKRKIILLIILLTAYCLLVTLGYAQNFKGITPKSDILAPEKSLNVGELFEYSIEWLGIPVGKIILKVEEIKNINGYECYHIVGRAMPNKFLTKFYDVEYTVHSYIDKETFSTHRFEKTRRVKDKFHYTEIDFDHKKKEVKFKTGGSAPRIDISGVRKQMETKIPVTLKILDGTQDLLSSIYHFRLLKIKENESYSINIYYDQRIWKVSLKAEGPFLKDFRNIGSFTVFGVSMNTQLSTFILGRPELFVYFTADSRRIPLEFKLRTALGLVRGIIKNFSPQISGKI